MGPYEFAAMQAGGYLQEIAHAAVLPPPAGHEDVIRVIFWCRPTYDEGMLQPAKSFLWKPSRPGLVTTLPIAASAAPPGQPEGQFDPFCAGHTFTPDGDLLVVGGLNLFKTVEDCNSPTFDDCILIDDSTPYDCSIDNRYSYGHRNAYVLRTDVDPPVWDSTPYTMLRERWYPSAVLLPDGRPLVSGHEGQPGPGVDDCQPVPPWVDFAGLTTLEVRESFDPVQNVFEQIEQHLLFFSGDCPTQVSHPQADYPRLHVLANRYLIHTNDEDGSAPRTRVADLITPPCPMEGPRWRSVDNPAVNRHGGSSVHFVVRNPVLDPALFPMDVVYAIGGVENSGDAQCLSPKNPSTDSVERMIDPQPGAMWNDETFYPAPPPLPSIDDPMVFGVGRGSHNAVILLDGSILIVGGASYKVGIQCAGNGARVPLRYYPPEVFHDMPPGVNVWNLLPAQTVPRKYHSVGGLLPDGRVFSAGGEGEASMGDPPIPAPKHTLEIYEPDYYFDASRPVIDAAPSVLVIGQGAELTPDIEATICPIREVGRVALIRNGSMTHAFDFHQRYVELSPGASGVPPNVTLNIVPPEDEFIAPPGWYLLVVIDDDGVPSEGKWVQVVQP